MGFKGEVHSWIENRLGHVWLSECSPGEVPGGCGGKVLFFVQRNGAAANAAGDGRGLLQSPEDNRGGFDGWATVGYGRGGGTTRGVRLCGVGLCGRLCRATNVVRSIRLGGFVPGWHV